MAMELEIAIKGRKSARAFNDRIVSRGDVENVLDLALRAPSGLNLQPWRIYAVSGEEKKRLSRVLLKAYREKQVSCSPKIGKPLPRDYAERSGGLPHFLAPYLIKDGITFQNFVNEGSCNFYGAPVALLFCIDKMFPKDRLVDIGILTAYVLLAAHSISLNTCPVALIAEYQEEIKELLSIGDNIDIVLGIALGYADSSNPYNAYKSTRDEPSSFVTWID
jgi:nitroreductase